MRNSSFNLAALCAGVIVSALRGSTDSLLEVMPVLVQCCEPCKHDLR